MSHWAPRILLGLLVAVAPWPFGSVTPRGATTLTAGVLLLYGAFWALQLLRGRDVTLPAGAHWVLLGLLFVAFQQLVLPPGLVRAVAPGAASTYAILETELKQSGWHSVSVEPFQTLWSFLQLLTLAAAFHLSNRIFQRTSEKFFLVHLLALTGVALALFAVYQKAVFGTILYGRFPVESATPFGPFVNHNHFAGYVEACALVALGAALGSARRSSSIPLLLGGAAVLMGIGHLLSHSRGGLLAFGSGLLALAWLSRGDGEYGRRFVLLGGGVVVAVFIFLFAPSSLFQRLSSFGSASEDVSVRYRVQLWKDSLELWSESPVVGTGLGTYAAVIPAYRSGPDETRAEYAESDWIQLLCEAGLMGLALAAIFLATVLPAGYRQALDDASSRSRGIAFGALAALVALVVHGFVDFNLRIPSNALLVAVLLGVLAPAGRRLTWKGRSFPRQLLAIGVLVTSVTAASHAVRLGSSEALNRRVNPMLTRPEEFVDIIQELVVSRDRIPQNPRTSYLLGRLYNEEAYRSRERVRYRELRLAQAGASFREAIRLAPARGRYWFELGWTEANLGNDVEADRLFTLALDLEPHWSNLRANYALFLVSRGRLDEALNEIEEARNLVPGLAPADALNIIGPYIGNDTVLLRRAAGEGPEAEGAIASFRRSQGNPK